MNTKLRCLLLDDELPGLAYLKLLCEQIPELEVVRVFNDPEIFLTESSLLDFDLCILDIEMPGINGIHLAGQLKDKLIIFTTAYKNYASDAFDLNAVDYVIKPIKLERLQQAVNKALHRAVQDKIKMHFWWNTDKGRTCIYFDQLAYVKTSEIDSRDKTIFLVNNNIFQLKNISFEKLLTLLPSDEFCRINKKELIALQSLQSYTNDHITTNIYLQANKTPLILTLGETYRAEFLKKTNR